MSRERVYRTRAIVLKRREQGEADRVITVFTPGMGKRTFMARGVRKPASRKAGHLEPFTHTALMLAKGKTWDIITAAETVTSFRILREDLDRAAHAYYFSELIDVFTQEQDSHPEVFDLLLQSLEWLETSPDPAILARWFELRLLRLVGFQPQLFHCVDCGDEIEPVTNYFSLEQGGVLCPRHGEGVRGAEPIAVGTLKVLRYLQSQPYNAVAQLQLSPGRIRQMEKVLAGHIRYVLERRLKTPQFIHSLRD